MQKLQMRHTLILVAIVFLSTQLVAQKKKKLQEKISLEDTAYIIVPLHDLKYRKTLIIEVGEKASIYLSGDSIKNEAHLYLTNDFVKNEYSNIITFLDSAFKLDDTVSIYFLQRFQNLEYLISQQLQNGFAKVFYKKQKVYVDTISHRLERFGEHGDRFFYLPDNRPFFEVTEILGIIDYNRMSSGKNFQDYINEGEKLASLRLR